MPKTKVKKKDSVRFAAVAQKVNKDQFYTIEEAVKLLKETASAKFVESIDLAMKLGVDPRKGDQNVRGLTNLPHGTGKSKKVAVLATGDAAKEAQEAGADVVGDDELIKQVQEGFKDFDVMLATSEMAPKIGKIARFLGPKTPNKRNGTVTDNMAEAVREIKGATRVEYRIDKAGVIHMGVGKVNFSDEQITENLLAAIDAVVKAKPSTAKGKYLQSMTVSTTMGPGIPLDPSLASKASGN